MPVETDIVERVIGKLAQLRDRVPVLQPGAGMHEDIHLKHRRFVTRIRADDCLRCLIIMQKRKF